MLRKLKRAVLVLLVVGVVAGGGWTWLQDREATAVAAADAVPYVTGTELAGLAYQAFRGQGTRVYEVECPRVADKELGQVTVCTGEDETGTPLAIEATTVEDPVKRFEFQRA